MELFRQWREKQTNELSFIHSFVQLFIHTKFKFLNKFGSMVMVVGKKDHNSPGANGLGVCVAIGRGIGLAYFNNDHLASSKPDGQSSTYYQMLANGGEESEKSYKIEMMTK